MAKKNVAEERFEKLEQDIQAMKLCAEEMQHSTDAKFDEIKELLVRQPRRRRGRPQPSVRCPREKEDNGVILDDEEEEEEAEIPSYCVWDFMVEDALVSRYDHHTEFAVGFDMSVLVEGLIASTGWELTLDHLKRKGAIFSNKNQCLFSLLSIRFT